MKLFADLVLPAIRWDADAGYETARAGIEHGVDMGAGGFILFGGERAAVQALTAALRAGSARSPLIASDLERGAGQQVQGLTPLPPLAALATLGDTAVVEAARITAREARDVGINWVLAPVCDLDLEPANPIVQTRAFGADAYDVARLAALWIETCQSEGVLACAKHFPGHGRTTVDSHAALPVVSVGRELERDLFPFRRAVTAGVATVMTAHVAYPAWDATGAPATHSRVLLRDLLRRDLYFGGLTVTDALIMEGARAGAGEAEGAARALAAGCDLLLYPLDPDAAVEGIATAVASDGVLAGAAAHASLRRDQAVHAAAEPAVLADAVLAAHRARGEALCAESVALLRGEPRRLGATVQVEIVDDDAGGPYPLPPRAAFQEALVQAGVAIGGGGERIVLLFADVKSWKGRAGLSEASAARLAALLERPASVVLCGHPRRLADIPGDGPVWCAWSGDVAMQRAAAGRVMAGDR